MKSEIIQ